MKKLFLILLISARVYAGVDAKDGKVINVATPTVDADATNKLYVDDVLRFAFGDGGVTDYTDFNDFGVMTMHGDARVGKHLVIGAASWRKGPTAPTDTYEDIFPTISFNPGQDDEVHYTTIVPHRWDDTTDMVVEIHWKMSNSGDTGKVFWKFRYIGVKLGENPADAGTEITQLTVGSHPQNELIETYFSTNMLVANLEREDSLGLMLWRHGTHVDDDLGEDAELIAVHIHYVMNQLGEPPSLDRMLFENGDVMLFENGDAMVYE